MRKVNIAFFNGVGMKSPPLAAMLRKATLRRTTVAPRSGTGHDGTTA